MKVGGKETILYISKTPLGDTFGGKVQPSAVLYSFSVSAEDVPTEAALVPDTNNINLQPYAGALRTRLEVNDPEPRGILTIDGNAERCTMDQTGFTIQKELPINGDTFSFSYNGYVIGLNDRILYSASDGESGYRDPAAIAAWIRQQIGM